MTSQSLLKVTLVLVLAMVFSPLAAEASHISGIRITPTNVAGLDVDIDVTVFYDTSSTETTAYLGTYFNHVPALDWGDGVIVDRYGYGPSTGIPLAVPTTTLTVNGLPGRAFRGSFSHTYQAAGNFTIAANTTCCPLTTPTYTLLTGTILTTSFNTSTPFSTNATVTTSFVQNTLALAVGEVSNALDIPTASNLGLVLLAGLLMIAAFYVLRRSRVRDSVRSTIRL